MRQVKTTIYQDGAVHLDGHHTFTKPASIGGKHTTNVTTVAASSGQGGNVKVMGSVGSMVSGVETLNGNVFGSVGSDGVPSSFVSVEVTFSTWEALFDQTTLTAKERKSAEELLAGKHEWVPDDIDYDTVKKLVFEGILDVSVGKKLAAIWRKVERFETWEELLTAAGFTEKQTAKYVALFEEQEHDSMACADLIFQELMALCDSVNMLAGTRRRFMAYHGYFSV